ncbi:MAG TPA: geranylgeranylglycerol-phosphate geranylgeranyltransferase [Chitinophagales bacterium]|nr:geranylgeranylglycerol-phosphate geranylgeranyltransferase [Chitinophagales bacterium]
MIHYLKLVRPVNLIVLALTLLLFRYCFIDVEAYRMYDFMPYLHAPSFYVLLVTTILIAASGYVINDIFDVDTDQINKPNQLIIGKHIDESKAFTFYMVLTSLGIIGSFILIFTTQQMKISMIPLVVSVLLYLYASSLKKVILVGNIVISICATLPILFVALYDLRINDFDTAVIILFTQGIGLAAIVYGSFAFLTTMTREIIKDVQDIDGDDAIGAKTFPIVLGINASKVLIIFFQLLTLSFLLLIAYYFLVTKVSHAFYGISLLLILPLLIQIGLVLWAKEAAQFKWASLVGKLHMLFGILTMLFFQSGTAPYVFNQMFNFFSQLLKVI